METMQKRAERIAKQLLALNPEGDRLNATISNVDRLEAVDAINWLLFQNNQLEDAIREARQALGGWDSPFLDDGIKRLRRALAEAERVSTSLEGMEDFRQEVDDRIEELVDQRNQDCIRDQLDASLLVREQLESD